MDSKQKRLYEAFVIGSDYKPKNIEITLYGYIIIQLI